MRSFRLRLAKKSDCKGFRFSFTQAAQLTSSQIPISDDGKPERLLIAGDIEQIIPIAPIAGDKGPSLLPVHIARYFLKGISLTGVDRSGHHLDCLSQNGITPFWKDFCLQK